MQYTPVFSKEPNILFMMTFFAQRQKEPFHALLIFDNICCIILLIITNLKNDRPKWLQNKNNKKVSVRGRASVSFYNVSSGQQGDPLLPDWELPEPESAGASNFKRNKQYNIDIVCFLWYD
ncbi:MAG: hypothetical protein UCN61_06055 [Ruminococcus sp.]|nr:hypothetical protein [Ruminococcus sp.]